MDDHDSVFGISVRNLWKKQKRRYRTGLTTVNNLPTDVAATLGAAELSFVNGENDKAIELLSEVCKKAPALAEPYHILGLIYESTDDRLKALQLFALAAALSSKNLTMWQKVIDLATDIGELDQALIALERGIHLTDGEEVMGYLIQKMLLLIQKKDISKAIDVLKIIHTKQQQDSSTSSQAGALLHSSISVLLQFATAVTEQQFPETSIKAHLSIIVLLLGWHMFPQDFLDRYYLLSYDKNSIVPADVYMIVESINQIYFSLRVAVDLLLERITLIGSISEFREGLEIIESVINNITSIVNSVPDGPTFSGMPIDLSILCWMCQIGSQQGTVSINQGLAMIVPVLQLLEDSEDANSQHKRLAKDDGSSSDSDNELDIKQVQPVEQEDELMLSLYFLKQRARSALLLYNQGMVTHSLKIIKRISNKLFELQVTHIAYSSAVPTTFIHLCSLVGSVYECMKNFDEAKELYCAATNALKANNGKIITVHFFEVIVKYVNLIFSNYYDERTTAEDLLCDFLTWVVETFGYIRQYAANRGNLHQPRRKPTEKLSAVKDFAAKTPVDTLAFNKSNVQDSDSDSEIEDGLANRESHAKIGSAVPEDNRMDIVNGNASDDELSDIDDFFSGSDQPELYKTDLTHLSTVELVKISYSLKMISSQLFALQQYAALLLNNGELLSYCCVTIPLLEHWVKPSSARQRTNLRSKELVTMYHLADVSLNTSTNSRHLDGLELTEEQSNYLRYTSVLASCFRMTDIFSSKDLHEMEKEAVDALRQLGHHDIATGLATDCKTKMKKSYTSEKRRMFLQDLRGDNKSGSAWPRRIRKKKYGSILNTARSYETDSNSDDSDEHESMIGREPRKALTRAKIALNKFCKYGASADQNFFLKDMGKYSSVAQGAALALVQDVDNIYSANMLFRSVFQDSKAYETMTNSKYLERNLSTHKLHAINPKSAVANLLLGHECATFRKHGEAIERYLNAYRIASDQPLVVLAVATYLIMLSVHPQFGAKHDTLMKGFSFLIHYRNLRDKQRKYARQVERDNNSALDQCDEDSFDENDLESSEISEVTSSADDIVPEVALRQELLYNIGRAYQDIKMNHFAAKYYKYALRLADKYECLRTGTLAVTKEAAHNLVLIYKQSHAEGLAMEVMMKHLCFE